MAFKLLGPTINAIQHTANKGNKFLPQTPITKINGENDNNHKYQKLSSDT